MSCCCCCSFEIEDEVFVVLFEKVHRPNLRRFSNRTSFMEANMHSKKIDMKHESMKRFRFCFGPFGDFITTIYCVLVECGRSFKNERDRKKKNVN
jgi:hypothetical protein